MEINTEMDDCVDTDRQRKRGDEKQSDRHIE